MKTNKTLIGIFILGISSGLPLLLISTTLQAWYTVAHLNLYEISLLGFVNIPYLLKFLWAPALERFPIKKWPRRKSWLLIFQIFIVIGLSLMSFLSPTQHAFLLAVFASIICFLSASQDLVINALQTEAVSKGQYGYSAACYVTGYRLALLISGGLALISAQYFGFNQTYFIMAIISGLSMVGTLWVKEPTCVNEPLLNRDSLSLAKLFWEPYQNLIARPQIAKLLSFITLYKLSFSLSFVLTPIFLLSKGHYSLAEIGSLLKGIGFFTTLIGGFLAGRLLRKWGYFYALMFFGFMEAFSNIIYGVIAWYPGNISLLIAAIASENFFAGMESTAFVGFIMEQCQAQYTATYFAFFTALSTIPRIFFGVLGVFIVDYFSWHFFYWFVFFSFLPIMVMAYCWRSYVFSIQTPFLDKKQNAICPDA